MTSRRYRFNSLIFITVTPYTAVAVQDSDQLPNKALRRCRLGCVIPWLFLVLSEDTYISQKRGKEHSTYWSVWHVDVG
jgi:hypothetical protein